MADHDGYVCCVGLIRVLYKGELLMVMEKKMVWVCNKS